MNFFLKKKELFFWHAFVSVAPVIAQLSFAIDAETSLSWLI